MNSTSESHSGRVPIIMAKIPEENFLTICLLRINLEWVCETAIKLIPALP